MLKDIKVKLVLSLILVLFISNGSEVKIKTVAQMDINFTEKWSFVFDDISTDLSISDIDRDGLAEISFHNGFNLYCLDHNGKTKWYSKEKHTALAFTLADVNEDGKLDFVIPYIADGIMCRNHKGEKLWYFSNQEYSRYAYPCITDLDGDSDLEIIINSENNNPFILTKKGLVNSNYSLIDNDLSNSLVSIYSTPIVVDIDLNNKNEILMVTSDEYLYCFDNEGSVIWSYLLNNLGYDLRYYSNLALIETSQGGIGVLINDYNELLCLNSTGKLMWNFELNDSYQGYTPVSSDIDNDGLAEILFPTFSEIANSGSLYCLDSNGNYKWSHMLNASPHKPILSDINNDGKLEILFAAGKKIYCLDASGSIEYIYENSQQDGDYIVLRLADLDLNGYLDLITATNEGELSCLKISSSYGSSSGWWTIGGTYQHYGQPDRDGDGLDDLSEAIIYKTDPHSKDSDNDGLPDSWEIEYGLDPLLANPNGDEDGDGFNNLKEFQLAKNPRNWDNWSRLFVGYFSPIWLGMFIAIVNFYIKNKPIIPKILKRFKKVIK